MTTIEILENWLTVPAENEHLEFKESKQQFSHLELLRYCVALANEGGGHLVLGVTNKVPRRVIGTNAFPSVDSQNKIKGQILDKLHIRVDIDEIHHEFGRVLVFEIPSRPAGQPLDYEGSYLMRSGASLVAMTPDQLKKIFAEDAEDWLKKIAVEGIDSEKVIDLLDTETYFRLLEMPFPDTKKGVLDRIMKEGLIKERAGRWDITNMGAILLAKDLRQFPKHIERKSLRFIIYEGKSKLSTLQDVKSSRGYAVGFEDRVNFIHRRAPQNRIVEEVLREEIKMFPLQAIRELVANALIHQDFSVSGTSVVIEMYSDRLEVSNPGNPTIDTKRFIDGYKSRNEQFADIMRRFRICEEKGSGIDKVVYSAEESQLPAPDFRVGETHTTAVLFAYQDFSNMNREDRVRACYQHCCLRYVCNENMTNHSLRQRFKLGNEKTPTVSQIISSTRDEELIKPDNPESKSRKKAGYLPYWA